MQCAECRKENPDGAKFCNECGVRLPSACPSCGKGNPPGSKFCNNCGQDLGTVEKKPEVAYDRPKTYTPKHLADQILSNRSAIEGERKLVTVLFADVANYTSMAERLDPEEVHQVLDGCFRILLGEIHACEGTINQFTGDGIMAIFGAPFACEEHAQRACYAALSIQQKLLEYAKSIIKGLGLDFKMRIGLDTGHVVVGAIGDDLRMDYTAVGDTTNLASRLQSAATPGSVFVSRHTYRLAEDFFYFKIIGKLELKGKALRQPAYLLLKPKEVKSKFQAAAAKGLTRFVGRERELQVFKDAFDKARSGSGQVVGILGEAGVGKSRLLYQMKSILPEGEYTFLEGRCLHFGGAMAYLPILDIVKDYFEIEENDRESDIKEKLDRKISWRSEFPQDSLPVFQSLLSLRVDDQSYMKLDPGVRKIKTFEALRDLFIAESRISSPLIIAVEDLHWIDKLSQEFIDYLIGWVSSTHILLILLYRPEYVHQWGAKSYYNRIGLDHLSSEKSLELVRAILDGGRVAQELEDLVLARAGGNPLFLEEFTHSLVENGSIKMAPRP